ncbi:MAG TPA: ComF family protein [Burkholderiaceae bacterium]|nr:ComF family protein [Burkholderiaceae bacterium]
MPGTAHSGSTDILRHWRPRCTVCAIEQGSPVCTGCERDFSAPDAARCRRCAERVATPNTVCGACLAHPPHFDETTALADYLAPVASMVTALKFGGRIDLADCFARLLARRESPGERADWVLPVPLSFEREGERGFNQAREIARGYARLTGVPLGEGILWRVRHSPPRQSLAREARRRNVRGAFAVDGPIAGRSLIVVDDVMTTGSTLDEIARVLKAAGAARVVNRVVARTP